MKYLRQQKPQGHCCTYTHWLRIPTANPHVPMHMTLAHDGMWLVTVIVWLKRVEARRLSWLTHPAPDFFLLSDNLDVQLLTIVVDRVFSIVINRDADLTIAGRLVIGVVELRHIRVA